MVAADIANPEVVAADVGGFSDSEQMHDAGGATNAQADVSMQDADADRGIETG